MAQGLRLPWRSIIMTAYRISSSVHRDASTGVPKLLDGNKRQRLRFRGEIQGEIRVITQSKLKVRRKFTRRIFARPVFSSSPLPTTTTSSTTFEQATIVFGDSLCDEMDMSVVLQGNIVARDAVQLMVR